MHPLYLIVIKGLPTWNLDQKDLDLFFSFEKTDLKMQCNPIEIVILSQKLGPGYTVE